MIKQSCALLLSPCTTCPLLQQLLPPLGLSSQISHLSTSPCVSQICSWPFLLHMGQHLGSHLELLHPLQLYLKSSGLLPKVGSWFMEGLGSCLGCSLLCFLKNTGCMPECTLQSKWDDAVRSCLRYCFSLYSMYLCVCVYIKCLYYYLEISQQNLIPIVLDI